MQRGSPPPRGQMSLQDLPRELWPHITQHAFSGVSAMLDFCTLMTAGQPTGKGLRAFPVWHPHVMTVHMGEGSYQRSLRMLLRGGDANKLSLQELCSVNVYSARQLPALCMLLDTSRAPKLTKLAVCCYDGILPDLSLLPGNLTQLRLWDIRTSRKALCFAKEPKFTGTLVVEVKNPRSTAVKFPSSESFQPRGLFLESLTVDCDELGHMHHLEELCAFKLTGDIWLLPALLEEVHISCVTFEQMRDLVSRVAYVTLETVDVGPDVTHPEMKLAWESPLKDIEVHKIRPKGRHLVLDLSGRDEMEGPLSVQVPAQVKVVYGAAQSD